MPVLLRGFFLAIVSLIILAGGLPVRVQAEAAGLPANSVLVFERGQVGSRDIYRSGPDLSTAEVLCPDPGDDRMPRLSPDKTRVIFTSTREFVGDADLWIADLDGSDCVQLTGKGENIANDLSPSWSPDGTRLIFEQRSESSSDLILYDLETETETPLQLGDWSPSQPVWSPGGDWIVFSCAASLCKAQPQPGSPLIQLIDNDLWTTYINPIWSSDGSRIAFTKIPQGGEQALWVMDADGGNPACVYGSQSGCLVARDAGRDALAAGSWDASSGLMIFSDADRETQTPGSPLKESRICLLDLPGRTIQDLSTGTTPLDANPDWRLLSPADLWVSFLGSPQRRLPGEKFWIELEYGNSGELDAQAVTLQLNLPDTWTVVDVQPVEPVSVSPLVWHIAAMPAGSSQVMRLYVQANNQPGQSILTTTVSGDPSELNLANNSDAAQIEILRPVFLPLLRR